MSVFANLFMGIVTWRLPGSQWLFMGPVSRCGPKIRRGLQFQKTWDVTKKISTHHILPETSKPFVFAFFHVRRNWHWCHLPDDINDFAPDKKKSSNLQPLRIRCCCDCLVFSVGGQLFFASGKSEDTQRLSMRSSPNFSVKNEETPTKRKRNPRVSLLKWYLDPSCLEHMLHPPPAYDHHRPVDSSSLLHPSSWKTRSSMPPFVLMAY